MNARAGIACFLCFHPRSIALRGLSCRDGITLSTRRAALPCSESEGHGVENQRGLFFLRQPLSGDALGSISGFWSSLCKCVVRPSTRALVRYGFAAWRVGKNLIHALPARDHLKPALLRPSRKGKVSPVIMSDQPYARRVGRCGSTFIFAPAKKVSTGYLQPDNLSDIKMTAALLPRNRRISDGKHTRPFKSTARRDQRPT